MAIPPPPYAVQRRAWDAAYMLGEAFAERLTLEQAIRMAVVCRVAPERLGWRECGDAIALYAQKVETRR